MKSNRHNIIYGILLILLLLLIIIIYYINKYYKKTDKISNKYENRLINLIKNKFNNTDNKLLIIPLFELGDSIVINGGIRYYSKIYKNIIYVCKKINYNFISYMYRDLDNISYFIIPDKYILSYLNYYVPINNNINKILKSKNIAYINMHDSLYLMNDFLKRSYLKLNLNINIAYNYFKIIRNYEREDILYNKLVNIVGYKYIILIDDQKRNFLVNKKFLKNKDYPIFNISKNSKNKNIILDSIKSDNLFDYIKILENAVEIISIDTCIPWLIDLMNINVKTSMYGVRADYIVYRNKNIKKLEIYIKEIIDTNININNYFIKNKSDLLLSYI
jgi:hypothetical protein